MVWHIHTSITQRNSHTTHDACTPIRHQVRASVRRSRQSARSIGSVESLFSSVGNGFRRFNGHTSPRTATHRHAPPRARHAPSRNATCPPRHATPRHAPPRTASHRRAQPPIYHLPGAATTASEPPAVTSVPSVTSAIEAPAVVNPPAPCHPPCSPWLQPNFACTGPPSAFAGEPSGGPAHLGPSHSIQLKIFAATWNVGEAPAPDASELAQWLPPGQDVYAISLQARTRALRGVGKSLRWRAA